MTFEREKTTVLFRFWAAWMLLWIPVACWLTLFGTNGQFGFAAVCEVVGIVGFFISWHSMRHRGQGDADAE